MTQWTDEIITVDGKPHHASRCQRLRFASRSAWFDAVRRGPGRVNHVLPTRTPCIQRERPQRSVGNFATATSHENHSGRKSSRESNSTLGQPLRKQAFGDLGEEVSTSPGKAQPGEFRIILCISQSGWLGLMGRDQITTR